eukprot:snap_masked-scaffold_8-processed-gene-8.57-mRNA-1 protein AED:1.00 eAED:1.00 QI:0/-1/0/0/-1/1/1/0/73
MMPGTLNRFFLVKMNYDELMNSSIHLTRKIPIAGLDHEEELKEGKKQTKSHLSELVPMARMLLRAMKKTKLKL